MTKAQRIEHKKANAKRREQILVSSKGQPKGSNLCIYLGGVGQKGKY